MRIFTLLLILNAGLIFSQTANHQIPFNPEKYICHKVSEPIKIDGKIDESAWKSAPWTRYFQDIEGDSKPKPYFDTRVKMLWDDEYFYFMAVMEEKHIWAKLKERDTVIFYDNDFEIFIDPDGDTHGYYEFEMNAFNTVWDLLLIHPYRDGNPVINGWHISGLKTAVDINGTLNNPKDEDNSWTVEIAMPWKILKERSNGIPKDGDQWRVNFSRVQWDTEVVNGTYVKKKDENGKRLPEHNWVWSAQGAINMHMPEMWGFVQFSEKAPGIDIEFNWNGEEDVKWALRKMYYHQSAYFKKHKKYDADLGDFEFLDVNGKVLRPTIQTTKSLYEVTVPGKNENITWHIRQDGKTWKTERN